MSEDKKKLRAKLRKTLKEKHEELKKNDEEISSKLKNLISNIKIQKSLQGPIIGGFAPHFEEPHWYRSFEENDKIALVHMNEDLSMSYHPIKLKDLLSQKHSLVLLDEVRETTIGPDIILVPGLGFNKKLERIGRGKGYFDRFLEKFEGISIGIFYECQLCDELFVEATDQKLNYIVTEKNVYH